MNNFKYKKNNLFCEGVKVEKFVKILIHLFTYILVKHLLIIINFYIRC